ncbi:proteoglycan 4-like isoform X2 [Dendropsophus ebraccatus]|uniref:proteoglycan 4-like isoform X2 n=1 Tax=Dendropsophus ebraccatus TaxID=150705 RepID=UPI003831773C
MRMCCREVIQMGGVIGICLMVMLSIFSKNSGSCCRRSEFYMCKKYERDLLREIEEALHDKEKQERKKVIDCIITHYENRINVTDTKWPKTSEEIIKEERNRIKGIFKEGQTISGPPPREPTSSTPEEPTSSTPGGPTSSTPGEPTSSTPGEPTSSTPGEPTSSTPGGPTSSTPGEPTSSTPGELTSSTPREPKSSTPGEPTSSTPGEPTSSTPGEPTSSTPGKPTSLMPGGPTSSTPGGPTSPPSQQRNVDIPGNDGLEMEDMEKKMSNEEINPLLSIHT